MVQHGFLKRRESVWSWKPIRPLVWLQNSRVSSSTAAGAACPGFSCLLRVLRLCSCFFSPSSSLCQVLWAIFQIIWILMTGPGTLSWLGSPVVHLWSLEDVLFPTHLKQPSLQGHCCRVVSYTRFFWFSSGIKYSTLFLILTTPKKLCLDTSILQQQIRFSKMKRRNYVYQLMEETFFKEWYCKLLVDNVFYYFSQGNRELNSFTVMWDLNIFWLNTDAFAFLREILTRTTPRSPRVLPDRGECSLAVNIIQAAIMFLKGYFAKQISLA